MTDTLDIWKIDVEDIDMPAELIKEQTPEQIISLLKAGYVIEAVI